MSETLTALDTEQTADVARECARVRAGIAQWNNVRGTMGASVADHVKHHRTPAIILQEYVRYAREVDLDIMTPLRAAFGKAPQIKGRKTIYSREERTRARFVLQAARSN